MTTITRAMLSPMVEAAISRLHVGERAVKAAEIVYNGAVQRSGDDWVVTGQSWMPYQVSIRRGTCTCPDAHHGAPRDDRGRRLCKHMLAAMMMVKLGATAPLTAASLIADLIARADGGDITLYVEAGHTGHQGTFQTDRLIKYRAPGSLKRVELAEALDVSLNNQEFWSAVEAGGYMRQSYNRAGQGLTVWYLVPAPVEVVNWPQPKPQTVDANDNPFD